MRISLLILSCTLSMMDPCAAQVARLDQPPVAAGSTVGSNLLPIGSPEGLHQLERAAWSGDRRASALLAVLLQDSPDLDGNLVKSALHFQAAVAAGCIDVNALAERALARLSPGDRRAYDQALPYWRPSAEPSAQSRGRCLSW